VLKWIEYILLLTKGAKSEDLIPFYSSLFLINNLKVESKTGEVYAREHLPKT